MGRACILDEIKQVMGLVKNNYRIVDVNADFGSDVFVNNRSVWKKDDIRAIDEVSQAVVTA